jgi:hypothetical protein
MLMKAIEAACALQLEHPSAKVIVVTDTRNRFLRGPQYNGRSSTDPPTEGQLRALAQRARGVTLATLLDPDMSFSAVRRYETNIPTMIGVQSGKRVGRPKKPASVRKTERREQHIGEVRRLHQDGRSIRSIAEDSGVPASTLSLWLRRPTA